MTGSGLKRCRTRTLNSYIMRHKLDKNTAEFVKNCDGVCAFVNDTIDKDVINTLYNHGIHVIAMRCAGYNNIDFKEAYEKISIVRVPGYSPYAVAEHAMGLLLSS